MATIRDTDELRSKAVSDFLDKYYYDPMCAERCHDKDRQIKGIDVVLSKGDVIGNVDEKAMTNYVNRNVDTFAFELEYTDRSGTKRNGWLIDKDTLTDYYMLIWVVATTENLQSWEDIIMLDCIMIPRASVVGFLTFKTYDYIGLKLLCDKIKNEPVSFNKRYYRPTDQDFYFVYSHTLKERPVNVVFYKSLIKSLSIKEFTVTRNV